jgi:hypothetical protein
MGFSASARQSFGLCDALPGEIGQRDGIPPFEQVATDGEKEVFKARVGTADHENHRRRGVRVLQKDARKVLVLERRVEERSRQAHFVHRRGKRSLMLGIEGGELRPRASELPGRAIAGESLQSGFACRARPASQFPAIRLRVKAIAITIEGVHPTLAHTIIDLGRNVKRLPDIEAAGRAPTQRGDKEQVHVRVGEVIALSQALVRPGLFVDGTHGVLRSAVGRE